MGESVILDASWVSAGQRGAAASVAQAASADLVQLCCTAPAELAAQRMSRRRDDVSDACPAVAARMARVQAPWPAAIVIDTSEADAADAAGPGSAGEAGTAGEAVRRALAAIRPHGPEHVWRPARPYMPPG